MENTVKGAFVVLQKKADPDIVVHKTQRTLQEVEEYLRKINFYLPEMKRLLYDGVEVEYYPRRSLYAFNTPCGLCDYSKLCAFGTLDGYIIGYDATEKKYSKPQISPTEIIKYETCPRQWAFYKVGVSTAERGAPMECGTCQHTAISEHILNGKDPVAVFREEWHKMEQQPLKYSQKDSFKSLLATGEKLMKKFPEKWESWGIEVLSIEQRETVELDNFILKGKPDLKGRKDGETVIIDWKFTGANYSDIWSLLADQMTAYAGLHLLKSQEMVSANS